MRFFIRGSLKTFQITFKCSTLNFFESIPATFFRRIENAIINASLNEFLIFNSQKHFFYQWVRLDLVLGSYNNEECSLIDQ